MKTINPDQLEEIVRRLVAEFQPEQIILFGSHAWGEPDEDSDVDLLVIVSESELRSVQRDVQAERCSPSRRNFSKPWPMPRVFTGLCCPCCPPRCIPPLDTLTLFQFFRRSFIEGVAPGFLSHWELSPLPNNAIIC
jgi:hypothetical protein